MSEKDLPCLAILDDDTQLCTFLREVAQMAGYQCITASDGLELPRLLEAHPDAIVLDLAMSSVDGIEVIRQLATKKYDGWLIIISGFDVNVLNSSKTLAELQGVKVAGVMNKPIRAEALNSLLQSLKGR